MKWCKHCKVTYDDSAFYCLKCGSSLISNDEYIKYLEDEVRRLKEKKEEDEKREIKLSYKQKINEIKNILGYDAVKHPYHGGYLTSDNPDIVNLMYDIVVKRKYNGPSLVEMLEKDKKDIKNKLDNVIYYTEEISKRTIHQYNRDIMKMIHTGLPIIYTSVINGGLFKGYKRKESLSAYDSGMSFDTYTFEVKYSINSLEKTIRNTPSNYIEEYYHAKKILSYLSRLIEDIHYHLKDMYNNPNSYSEVYDYLSPSRLERLDAINHGIDF